MFSNGVSGTIVQPGYLLNWYPEGSRAEKDPLQEIGAELACLIGAKSLRFSRFRSTADAIDLIVHDLNLLGEEKYLRHLTDTRQGLKANGFTFDNLTRMLAHISIAVRQEYGFDLHHEQLFCAWVLLHGFLGEMATGEGKSITAAVAAIVAATGGAPVHIVTTNDYLVERDAMGSRKLFQRFGITSDFVVPEKQDDERRAAYASDVCYVSNKQLVFDYLRDRQTMGNQPSALTARIRGLCTLDTPQPLLRGLCFAIVDEADSVLVDEAITPLVLSYQIDEESNISPVVTAISLAQRLDDSDYSVDKRFRRVSVTEAGEVRLAELASGLEGTWKNKRYRHEMVRQALTALHLFQRDVDYMVRDGEVLLVDQSTGRLMPDRKLQNGLHQMVETKERCEVSGKTATLASLSFQHFFQRYQHLCGMTGTASEAASELRETYGLGVVGVPTHQTNKRVALRPVFSQDSEFNRSMILEKVKACHQNGQPVLIGTRTIMESERLSEIFSHADLTHQLLNARQDKDEAAVVAQAGVRGAITIATNMAGRGTDIPLGEGVADLGGLHVIIVELNDNQRIDRQLIGRCARQADPGTYEYVIALSDAVLTRRVSLIGRCLFNAHGVLGNYLWQSACMMFAQIVQYRHEKQQQRIRKQVAVSDLEMQKKLSFTGYKE